MHASLSISTHTPDFFCFLSFSLSIRRRSFSFLDRASISFCLHTHDFENGVAENVQCGIMLSQRPEDHQNKDPLDSYSVSNDKDVVEKIILTHTHTYNRQNTRCAISYNQTILDISLIKQVTAVIDNIYLDAIKPSANRHVIHRQPRGGGT